MMKLILLLIIFLSVAINMSYANTPPSFWQKRYQYEDCEGTTVGGSPACETYDLYLNAAKHSCRLTIEGYQTDEHIICSALTDMIRIDIRFKSYSDGKTVNAYGVSEYPVGSSLFTLLRSGGRVITELHSMRPSDKLPIVGNYFEPPKTAVKTK